MRSLLVTALMTAVLLGPVSGAGADPIEDFCDGSPRDGKAVWYRIICE